MGETKVGGRACGAAQSSDYLRLDTPGMPRACCKVDVHGATLVHSGELAFAEYGRRSDSHGSLLTQLVGIFLFGITCLFLVIQLKAPDAKPFAWLSQGVGWSLCLVLNLMNEKKCINERCYFWQLISFNFQLVQHRACHKCMQIY